jgi:transcriptional regulator with XRE-family HTH domain
MNTPRVELLRLGSRIRIARTALGYNQRGFATACGLTRTYVGGVERGERNVTFSVLCTLCTALGCDVAAPHPGHSGRGLPANLTSRRKIRALLTIMACAFGEISMSLSLASLDPSASCSAFLASGRTTTLTHRVFKGQLSRACPFKPHPATATLLGDGFGESTDEPSPPPAAPSSCRPFPAPRGVRPLCL